MAPNPSRHTGRSPPMRTSPLFAAGKPLPEIPVTPAVALSLMVLSLVGFSSAADFGSCNPEFSHPILHSSYWMREPRWTAYEVGMPAWQRQPRMGEPSRDLKMWTETP